MELVDSENSLYLKVDNWVALVLERKSGCFSFFSGTGGGIGTGGFIDDDDEGSLLVTSVLVFFSSCFTGLIGAGLFGGGGGPSDCFGLDFTVVSVVCCSVLNCGGGNLPVAHSGGGFVVFLPASTSFNSSGGSLLGFGISLEWIFIASSLTAEVKS